MSGTQTAALVVFVVSLLFVSWTYLGYPLVVSLWSRLASRPWRRERTTLPATVIVCMHDEERVAAAKCQNLISQSYAPGNLDIIIVSDGSTDRTSHEVRSVNNPQVRLLEYAPQQGKWKAINLGVTQSRGDILVFTDARQLLAPDAVERLLENFADPRVGAVSGEMLFGASRSEFGKTLDRYWSYEKLIRRKEAEIDSTCGVTGCLWAMRKELFTPLPENTILDDVFLPMEVVRQGYRVVFDPQAIVYDTPSESSDIEFHRKRRTLFGNYQLLRLSPWILGGRNRIRFQFVSHKVCRLLVPYFLLLILVSSILLPGPFFRCLMFLQIAFYALGGLHRLIPDGTILRKVAAVANFFTVVNFSATSAFAFWLLGYRDIWTRPAGRGLPRDNHV